MKIQYSAAWLFVLAASIGSYAAAQSEPFYIPNTTSPSDSATLPPNEAPRPYVYTAPPSAEENTGRPASGDATPNKSALFPSPIYTYTQIGTEGLGVGYGMKVNPSWVVRAEINAISSSKDFSKANNNYTGRLKLRSEGVYADYYPIEGNPARVTGGLMLNQSTISGTTDAASINLDGTSYALASPATARVKLSPVMPYLGIGYGHDEPEKAGFKFHADAGLAIGKKPEVTLSATPTGAVNAVAFENARKAEEDKIANDVKKMQVLPVLKIGAGYTW
jgi:hypothetical protein